ncbi:hypothetical protein Pelo_11759 [Pelomyxa schiedti]|nr:hypothetical protein Pelo_11759 [Pelomyxa schiedti]
MTTAQMGYPITATAARQHLTNTLTMSLVSSFKMPMSTTPTLPTIGDQQHHSQAQQNGNHPQGDDTVVFNYIYNYSEEVIMGVEACLGALFETVRYNGERGMPCDTYWAPSIDPALWGIFRESAEASADYGTAGRVALCGGQYLVAKPRTNIASGEQPLYIRLVLLSLTQTPEKEWYSFMLYEWSAVQHCFAHFGIVYRVPKMQSPCPVAIPAASPILSGLFFTPETFWAAMSQGTASKIAWISVIQNVKGVFHADLSSWGNLNACDYGDCISQKRWMQICALLSSPIEEFQIGQQAIDELASLGSNFGFLGRKEAEALLLEKPTKGMLIRFCDSSDGLCAASINTGLGVFHLRLCRRWPSEVGTWMDCKGVVAYKPGRRHERAGWYVVHKENEQQQPELGPADSLKQLVEVSLVRFLGVWLHSRC